MSKSEKMARFNLVLTFVWIALAFPSIFFWSTSLLWIIVISLWANIVGHFSAYLAAHSESAQEKGHNLTEQDMAWLKNMITSPPPATTATTPTANAKQE